MENATSIPHEGSAPSGNADSVARGHETSDAKLRPIIIFVVVMFGVAILIHFGVWRLMRVFEHRNETADPVPSPFVSERMPPTRTPLQPSIGHPTQPFEDMNALRARWEREMKSYGPVAGHPDLVRIPVDRAMQMMVERGIASPASRPTTMPGGAP